MDYTTPRIPSPCAAGRGPGSTAIELGWRCNARCDPLHHNPNRNPNLPMDFGSKSKSTIKNFAKCLNSTAVHPDPLPRGDSDRGARAPRPQFGAPSRRTSRAADVTGTIILAHVRDFRLLISLSREQLRLLGFAFCDAIVVLPSEERWGFSSSPPSRALKQLAPTRRSNVSNFP